MFKDPGLAIDARVLKISEAPRNPLQQNYLDLKSSLARTLARKAQDARWESRGPLSARFSLTALTSRLLSQGL